MLFSTKSNYNWKTKCNVSWNKIINFLRLCSSFIVLVLCCLSTKNEVIALFMPWYKIGCLIHKTFQSSYAVYDMLFPDLFRLNLVIITLKKLQVCWTLNNFTRLPNVRIMILLRNRQIILHLDGWNFITKFKFISAECLVELSDEA